MSDIQNQNMEMGWDETIVDDGGNYEPIGEGDFLFVVENMERGRFPGGSKLSACNKATLTLGVFKSENVKCSMKVDLLLHRQLEWKLSQFFRSIGQKKHGEQLKMDWTQVVGAMGRAHFKPRKWTAKDGSEKFSDDVEKFLEWDESKMKANPDGIEF